MFTLGRKEVIVNNSASFPVTVTSPPGTTSLLTIKGLGTFESTHVVSALAQRFIPGRTDSIQITAPEVAELGILASEVNVPVVVHIRVNTARHTSEWAIDFIKRGRPFIFEIIVNGTDTSTVIMNKLVEQFSKYESRFTLSENGLPFTWTQTDETVILTTKSPFLSLQNNVDFLPKGSTYGVKATTTKVIPFTTIGVGSVGAQTDHDVVSSDGLMVGDKVTFADTECTITNIPDSTTISVTPAVDSTDSEIVYLESGNIEPTFDGKYLEENVRMSLPTTADSYAISPGETPTIVGEYTELTFIMESTNGVGINNLYGSHKFLGNTRGEIGSTKYFTFTLYFLEGTDLFDTDGKVDDILDFLLAAAPSTTKMYISTMYEVATVADFLAN